MQFVSTDLINNASVSAFTVGSVTVHTVSIDFGLQPVDEKKFTITDGSITPTSKVIGGMYYNSALVNKDPDDLAMDPIGVLFVPGSGIITVYAYGIKGFVSGQYALYYMVG